MLTIFYILSFQATIIILSFWLRRRYLYNQGLFSSRGTFIKDMFFLWCVCTIEEKRRIIVIMKTLPRQDYYYMDENNPLPKELLKKLYNNLINEIQSSTKDIKNLSKKELQKKAFELFLQKISCSQQTHKELERITLSGAQKQVFSWSGQYIYKIGFHTKNPIYLSIIPERWYHKLFKLIGIAKEIQFGDKEFDKKYFFITDNPATLELLHKNTNFYARIKEIFTYPIQSLHIDYNKIWFSVLGKDTSELAIENKTEFPIFRLCDELIESLNKNIPYQNNKKITFKAYFFLTLHACLFAFGLLNFFSFIIDNNNIIDQSLFIVKSILIATALTIVWFFILIRNFFRTAWICQIIIDFFLFGIIGFYLSTFHIVREMNIFLPQPPAKNIYTPIAHKECVLVCCSRCSGKGSNKKHYHFYNQNCTPLERRYNIYRQKKIDNRCNHSVYYDDYILHLTAWQTRYDDYEFSVSKRDFDNTIQGDKMRVPTYKGFLNIEWVNSQEVKREK